MSAAASPNSPILSAASCQQAGCQRGCQRVVSCTPGNSALRVCDTAYVCAPGGCCWRRCWLVVLLSLCYYTSIAISLCQLPLLLLHADAVPAATCCCRCCCGVLSFSFRPMAPRRQPSRPNVADLILFLAVFLAFSRLPLLPLLPFGQ